MKKIFLLFTLLFCVFLTKAQYDKNIEAMQLVSKHSEAIGLSPDQLSNLKVSSAYFNEIAGTEMVYLLQTYKGLPVYNQMLVLAFKNDKVVSNAGALLADMSKLTNQQGATPSVSAIQAVNRAFTEAMLPAPSLSPVSSSDNGTKLNFGKPASVTENVTAELMWVPIEKGNLKSVKLAWQVQVFPQGKADTWYIQVDAVTGAVINKYNLTVYEKQDQKADYLSLFRPKEDNLQPKKSSFEQLNLFNPPPPPTVTGGDYRIYPIPVESPNYGSTALIHNPWEASGVGNNAITNGWHFDGTTNYSWTRGNNVFAYLDVASTNSPNATNNWPDTSTTAIPTLTFTQTPVTTQEPAVIINKKFALNNLFYWNNMMHDVYYQYGFNEVSGNFQTDNLGRGGNGNDYVQAEAQDGAGMSNANFSTPADGTRPRMQMFLWAPAPTVVTLHANAPGPFVGDYPAIESVFSINNKLGNVGPVTGDVVYFNDAAGGTHEACSGAPSNTLTGKIALINRGNCNFTVKVLAAQNAGAIGVIMVNNVAGDPIAMGGTDNTVTIPAIMISDITGALFVAQLGNGLNVTMSGTLSVNIDGDVDNGIVCHEFGHGISNRLTGGPNVSGCLQNGEQGGEGWSDFVALMMTTDWTTALVTDGVLKPRPMGLYALGGANLFATSAPGVGIRHYKYCTDIAVNPLTYADLGTGIIGTEVHNTGEVWAEILWEMTWALIQQDGINPNIFNATGTGGNSVAMKLVIEGMKLQPCSPGFVDARNAIMTADQNLYGGAHLCTLWAAFAKRGMGYSALQGSSFSAADQTAAFNLPPIPSLTAQPANTAVCAGTNASFSVTSTGYNLTYKWQVSTNGGANWSDVSPAVTTATLTLVGVTVGMNGNQYRCVVSGGCPNTPVNSNAGTLTVNTSTPSITAQPSNTSVCAGTNATFTIAVAGTNTYNWQVSTNGGANWNDVSPVNTTTTLTLNAVTLSMSGNLYRCVVTGGCPTTSVNSSAALLTVTTGALSITADPSNASACAGGNASFSVTATGASITYNWQVSTNGGANWNDVAPPVNTPTLTLTGVTAGMNNNQYRCIVNGPGACTPAGLTSAVATLTITSAVAITTQPVNVSVCTGNDATFTIAVSGVNPTYRWQESTNGGANWNDVVPAATGSTLTLTAVTAGMNNNQYRAVVNGDCTPAEINSNAGTLTINTPASITAQPVGTTVCVGSDASFTVAASGSGLSYNWQVSTNGGANWNDLVPAVTTATLTLNAVTAAMNNNQYRCVVSIACNPAGVNSDPAVLNVNSAPSITAQPASATACEGGNASFCVTATGFNVGYQWQVNLQGCSGAGVWVNVVGGNSNCLNLTGVTAAMNDAAYRCIVSGGCTPSVTTDCGTLTVNTAAAITAQPVSTTGCTGGNASFSVTATGTGVTYNWQVSTNGGANWNDLVPAVNTPTLSLTNVTAAMNNNQYRCVVAGTCTAVGIISDAATLTLNTTTSITAQPADAGVCAGTSVIFNVAAAGSGLTYNWQVSTDGGANWSNVSPVNTTTSFEIADPTVAMSGNMYRCVVAGACNTVNSNAATLTVNTSVAITVDPQDVIGCTGSAAVFTATVTGSSIAYQWQVSVGGGPFVDLTNNPPYSGVNTATLTVNPATGQNGNVYRLNASGAPCGGTISSATALLDVKALPVVVLTTASYSNITPYIRTTLYTTVSPAGTYSYQWYRDGVLVPSITGDRFAVTVDDFGDYEVIVTDLNTGCSSNKSNISSVDYASSGELFIYPNPSSGQFQVRYYSSTSNSARTLNIYDSKGARVYTQSYPITSPYTKMDVNMNNAASDVYMVELRDASGKRLATGKVAIK